MATGRLISRLVDELKESPVGSNVMFSFVLAGVEKILEVEFACPCETQKKWNACYAAAFFVTPAFIVFLIMLMIYPLNCRDCSPKCLYSLIPPVVWVDLLFLDGQYFVCATADWSGTFVTAEKTYLKWCTPTNTTRTEELMAHSHKMHILSQGIGIGLLMTLAVVLLVYVCVKLWGSL